MSKIPRKLNFDSIKLELNFYCVVDRNLYNFGALRMECEGRSYILDVVQSYTNEVNNATEITCDLAIDKDVFIFGNEIDQCPYDLKEEDFYNSNFKATFYIGEEWEVKPDSITLFIINNGTTIAKDVEIE